MKTLDNAHRARPWRIHALAADFELLDVWRFELPGAGIDAVAAAVWRAAEELSGSLLGRMRLWIGGALRWDDHDFTRPIPGCRELSVADRLEPAERAGTTAPWSLREPLVRTVYAFADESLYEVSNDTIHALIHLGVVDGGATLAVYIKSRGLFSRAYMAAIAPFRHAIVYPALIASVERGWGAVRAAN